VVVVGSVVLFQISLQVLRERVVALTPQVDTLASGTLATLGGGDAGLRGSVGAGGAGAGGVAGSTPSATQASWDQVPWSRVVAEPPLTRFTPNDAKVQWHAHERVSVSLGSAAETTSALPAHAEVGATDTRATTKGSSARTRKKATQARARGRRAWTKAEEKQLLTLAQAHQVCVVPWMSLWVHVHVCTRAIPPPPPPA